MDAHPHVETFRVDHDGGLVRSVVPGRGQPYEHRCPVAAFEAAAHAADELAQDITLARLREAAGVNWTEAAVALAFFKERGILTPTHGRTHAVAGTAPFEDAMTEYHALREVPR